MSLINSLSNWTMRFLKRGDEHSMWLRFYLTRSLPYKIFKPRRICWFWEFWYFLCVLTLLTPPHVQAQALEFGFWSILCQLPLLCGGISLAVTWDVLLLRVHLLECPSLASLPAEDLSMFWGPVRAPPLPECVCRFPPAGRVLSLEGGRWTLEPGRSAAPASRGWVVR